jgi:hypothetical protein
MKVKALALLTLAFGSLSLGECSRISCGIKLLVPITLAPPLESRISRKLVATIPIPSTEYNVVANLSSASGVVYLTDIYSGKMFWADWRTKKTGEWVKLDSPGCSPRDIQIQKVYAMKTKPYLLVLNCHRIELLDNKTFLPKNVFPSNTHLIVSGFDVSSDERNLAISIQTNPTAYSTLIYQTADWSIVHRWDFGNSYFSPNGTLLATSNFRRKNPSSLLPDECGLDFYSSTTGQRISGWILDVDKVENHCPNWPIYFPEEKTGTVVTDDVLDSAISEWDTRSGKLIRHLKSTIVSPGPAPDTRSVSISADGSLLAVVRSRAEWKPEYGLDIWDLSIGTSIEKIPLAEQPDPITGAFFSVDGTQVAFVHKDRVEIFEYTAR